MREIRRQVIPIEYQQVCEDCNKIVVFTGYEPVHPGYESVKQYEHKCKGCNSIEYFDKKYPYIKYEALLECLHTHKE